MAQTPETNAPAPAIPARLPSTIYDWNQLQPAPATNGIRRFALADPMNDVAGNLAGARMAKAGGIVLDGADVTDVSKRIAVTPDLPSRMEIDGEPLDPVQGLVILLNKPLGMTCSHKEE